MCAYLLKNGACASIYDQGCFAVYVNVGFASAFCVLQLYQGYMFLTEHSECWSDLKKEHRSKREKKREEIAKRRKEKKRDDILNHTMPEAVHIRRAHTKHSKYDKRGRGRSHSRKVKPDQNREADLAIPKPVKHKASRGKMRHDGSRHHQARNGQAAREIGAMFSSSGRASPSSTYTDLSGPSAVSRRRMNGTSQRSQVPVENIRPPRVLLNSASFLRSEHGSILSRPGASSEPSIQRHATGASSHRSRRRRHEHPVEDVSPLSSVVELSHLTPHEHALLEPSICSSDHPPLPVIKVTPCDPGRNSIASQSSNDRPHSFESVEALAPRDRFTAQYGRWYSPSDAGYSEVARPRAGQASTTYHTGNNEGHSLPGVRMIEGASPSPYESGPVSKVWDWIGKTVGED